MTNKDGSQSVQTVKNELGMKPKDMADIKARLQEQGIDGDYKVDLYGQADNRDQARNPNAKPVNTLLFNFSLFAFLKTALWWSRWLVAIEMVPGRLGTHRASNLHKHYRPKVR